MNIIYILCLVPFLVVRGGYAETKQRPQRKPPDVDQLALREQAAVAIHNDNVEDLRLVINDGLDLTDEYATKLLWHASYRGAVQCVLLLIENNVKPPKDHRKWDDAYLICSYKLTEKILESDRSVDLERALKLTSVGAPTKGEEDDSCLAIMKLLIERYRVDPAYTAADGTTIPMLLVMSSGRYDNKTAIGRLRYLVDKGASIDAVSNSGHTALFLASQAKNQQMVDFLKSLGAVK